MSLPQRDSAFLADRGLEHRVSLEANMTCVVLSDYGLPHGYDREKSDLLVRLPPGFPDVPPDMWWFDPPVQRVDGSRVHATDAIEQHLGRAWQRWSRHFNAGQWKPETDSLESFLALIRRELERCATNAAAA
jgi:hypothetical protein